MRRSPRGDFGETPATVNTAIAVPEKFLLIAGEEVTSSARSKPAHVNGFGIRELVQPAK